MSQETDTRSGDATALPADVANALAMSTAWIAHARKRGHHDHADQLSEFRLLLERETLAHEQAGRTWEQAKLRAYRQARVWEPNMDAYDGAMSTYAAAFGNPDGEPSVVLPDGSTAQPHELAERPRRASDTKSETCVRECIVYWWRRLDLFRPRGSYYAPRCGWCGNRHHSTNGYCDFTRMR